MEELQGTEGKDKLVAAVKASFDFCTTALAKADDSKLNDNITWFDGKPRARAWAFVALASSWADHYGMAAMYLRLNGLLPPSAQKAKAEEKKPEEKKAAGSVPQSLLRLPVCSFCPQRTCLSLVSPC